METQILDDGSKSAGYVRGYAARQEEVSRLLARVRQLEAALGEARELVDTIEIHCPCGARPESPRTHPHVGWCPVAALKDLLVRVTSQNGPSLR